MPIYKISVFSGGLKRYYFFNFSDIATYPRKLGNQNYKLPIFWKILSENSHSVWIISKKTNKAKFFKNTYFQNCFNKFGAVWQVWKLKTFTFFLRVRTYNIRMVKNFEYCTPSVWVWWGRTYSDCWKLNIFYWKRCCLQNVNDWLIFNPFWKWSVAFAESGEHSFVTLHCQWGLTPGLERI